MDVLTNPEHIMTQFNLNSLAKHTKVDEEKLNLIEGMLPIVSEKVQFELHSFDIVNEMEYAEKQDIPPAKVCPQCGRKYPGYENFCLDCSVKLKDIEEVNIKNVEVEHVFICEGSDSLNDFKEILTPDNLVKINGFKFRKPEFNKIIKNIKSTALKNLDNAIKENDINLDSLTILEKIILFTKAFVNVKYKSYGQELGYYSFNEIFVDDRQLDSLQITTMLHELTHFLIKEILTQMLCMMLDLSKTKEMESIITFIMSFSAENCLIDEYAAHTVEGRFTLFGYQDYSSFLNIQNSLDRPAEEIEMLKTIGNTFANVVKGIVESFVDDELLDEIKSQFRKDILDDPDYAQLKFENCTLLNYTGFSKAIKFILLDGFATASENLDKLYEINDMW